MSARSFWFGFLVGFFTVAFLLLLIVAVGAQPVRAQDRWCDRHAWRCDEARDRRRDWDGDRDDWIPTRPDRWRDYPHPRDRDFWTDDYDRWQIDETNREQMQWRSDR